MNRKKSFSKKKFSARKKLLMFAMLFLFQQPKMVVHAEEGPAVSVESVTDIPVEDVDLEAYVKEHYHLSEADFQTLCSSIAAHLNQNGEPEANFSLSVEIFYNLAQIPMDEKIAYILEQYPITFDEFQYVAAGCMAEAVGSGTNYLDAFAVANDVVNRTNDQYYYSRSGDNPYNQFVAKSQFSVVKLGMVEPLIGRTDLIGYQAVVDYFYSRVALHDFVDFRAPGENYNGVQFTYKGNVYNKVMDQRVLKP